MKMSPKAKKLFAVCMCLVVFGCIFVIGCFATDSTTVTEPGYADAAEEVYESVHAVINFTNILAIIGVAIGGEATLFLLWWGIRKVIRLIKNGLNGKLKA